MQCTNFSEITRNFQNSMYASLNEYSTANLKGGRALSFGSAIADGALSIIRRVARVVDAVLGTGMNLYGAARSYKGATLHDAYLSAKEIVNATFSIPAAVISSPLTIFHQIVLGLKDPQIVKSMDHLSNNAYTLSER